MAKILVIEKKPGHLEGYKMVIQSMGLAGENNRFVDALSEGIKAGHEMAPDIVLVNHSLLTEENVKDFLEFRIAHPTVKIIGIIPKSTDGETEVTGELSGVEPDETIREGDASSKLISVIQSLLPKDSAQSTQATHVLIVEDSRMLQKMYMMYINNSDLAGKIHLTICGNAEDGLLQLEKQSFDMMILDWELPGMNGLQCLKKIRQNPGWKTMPIIMSTQIADKQKIVSAIQSGVNDYIIKPINPDSFISKIKSRLNMQPPS